MTTGRINQIAIFFVCVISGFSSLARREYPKRNEVRQNELTNFHKSSARAWLCESESKSAGFQTQTAKSLCCVRTADFSLSPALFRLSPPNKLPDEDRKSTRLNSSH